MNFGTAGIPIAVKGEGSLRGVKEISDLGLDCMEIEFVYGVRMKDDTAKEIGDYSKKEDITLTVHAPYYINLNSDEEEKYEASINRILKSAEKGSLLNARSVTFHAGFKMDQPDEQVHENILQALKKIRDQVDQKEIDIALAPELTGKKSQWGSLDELIDASSKIKGVRPCIDFSHYYARHTGTFNEYDDFMEIFQRLESELGGEVLESLHMHASGISYTDKGEEKHFNFQEEESDFNYKDLIKAITEKDVKGYLICESPNLEEDALTLREMYGSC